MIFGQGSMRCHPYLYEELQLLQAEDPKAALNPFDTMLFKHLGYTFNRTARSFAYAFSGGSSAAPQSAVDFTRPYYKIINRLSANFALTADMCLGLLQVILNARKCFLAVWLISMPICLLRRQS
jgi:Domain of unknown function (DUF1974).